MKISVTNDSNRPRELRRSVEDVGGQVKTLKPGESTELEFADDDAGKAAAARFVDHLKRYGWTAEVVEAGNGKKRKGEAA